jgi:hypothetical protein
MLRKFFYISKLKAYETGTEVRSVSKKDFSDNQTKEKLIA